MRILFVSRRMLVNLSLLGVVVCLVGVLKLLGGSPTVTAWVSAGLEAGQAPLFLAGNQLGTTRTIPIAIYFEWMNGNTEATWFWTIVLLVFSFAVILFINLWSRHTTRYRQQPRPDGRSPKPRRQGRRGGGRRSAEGGER